MGNADRRFTLVFPLSSGPLLLKKSTLVSFQSLSSFSSENVSIGPPDRRNYDLSIRERPVIIPLTAQDSPGMRWKTEVYGKN